MHSPLPPPMSATLDTIAGKLDHAITVIELTCDRVRQLEDGRIKAERVEASMRGIAMRLSAAGVAMSVARAAAAVAVPTRALAIMAAGSFAGGFLGTVLWQLVHTRVALAGVLP